MMAGQTADAYNRLKQNYRESTWLMVAGQTPEAYNTTVVIRITQS